jgi:tetratricopeptide (TPR) repeat protein
MAKRYFNWKLAFVLVIGAVVLVVTALALRRWQKATRADRGLDLGIEAYEDYDWPEAARQLGRFLAVNPEEPDVLLLYARAQLNIRPLEPDGFAQAISALRSILRIEEGHAEAARELAEAYMLRGEASEAQLHAERCLNEGDANDLDLQRLVVCAMVRQRKYDEAQVRLESLVNARPDQVWAYELLAYLEGLADQAGAYGFWTRRGSADPEAVKWLDEAIDKNRDSAMAYIARAGYYLMYPDPEDPNVVSSNLDRAEQANPSDVETRLRLLWMLIDAQQFERARTYVESLQGQARPDAVLWLPPRYTLYTLSGRPRIDADQAFWRQRARLAMADGDAEEKATVAEEGLAALVAQPWDYMPVAVDLLIRAGRVEKAREHLSEMRRRDINPAETASLEGDLARKEGRLRDAVSSWQMALSIMPGQVRGKGSEIRAKLADALARLGDRQSAVGQLRAAISESPTDRWLRRALVQLLFEAGDWARVLEEAGQLRRMTDGTPAELTLMELQSRIHLMPRDNTPEDGPPDTRPELARRLAWLEIAAPDANGVLTATLGRAREAIARDDLTNAARALDEVEAELWQSIEKELVALDSSGLDPHRVLLLRTQAALRQGEHEAANRWLDQIEATQAGAVEVVLLRAALHDAQDEVGRAVALLREAIEQHPESFELVRALAALLSQHEEHDECEAVLQEAFGRMETPSVRRALGLLLAELYGRTGREDDLHRWLVSMAEEFPHDIQTRQLLLACDAVASDPEVAQHVLEQIRQIEGEEGWRWRAERAKLWLRSEGFEDRYYEQAVKLLQKNLLANPEDGYSRRLLGDAHIKGGEVQLAITEYREALNRSPSDVGLVLRLVSAYRMAGDTDAAMKVVQGAVARGLDSPSLRRLQLDFYMLGGAWDLASVLSQQLADEDPNDVSARRAQVHALARQKKFDEAERALEEAMAATPNQDSLLVTQIWLELQRENEDEAIQLCDTMVADRQDVFSHLLRAWAYASLELNDKATEDYGLAIEKDSGNPRLWKTRGDFLRQRGRIAEALRDYREALKLAPEDPAIQQAAIDSLLASGDAALGQEAETLIEQALQADPNDPQIRFYRAWTLMSKGTASAGEAARRILAELIDERPDMAQAWELLARLELRNLEPGKAVDYAERGLAHNRGNRGLTMLKAAAEAELDPRLAIFTLDQWVAMHPGDASAVVRLAHWLTEAGDAERAVKLLQEQLTDAGGAPASQVSKLALARALYKRGSEGDRARARALYDALIQETPDDARPLAALTELLSAEKAWGQARQLLETWFEQHSDHPHTVTYIANGLWPTEDKEGRRTAEELLRMVKERHPDHIPTLMVLAVLLQQDDRSDEAVQLNRRILDLDPNSAVAMNNLAWILCEVDGSESALEQALRLAQDGLRMSPEYADLIDTRGLIYYRLGEYAKAVEDFQMCLPQFRAGSAAAVSCHINLARAYGAMGRKTQASQELGRAAEELRQGLDRLEANARFEGYPDRRAYATSVLKKAMHLDDEIWLQYPDMVTDVNALLVHRQKGG